MNQTINGSVLFWVVMAVTVGLLLLGWFKKSRTPVIEHDPERRFGSFGGKSSSQTNQTSSSKRKSPKLKRLNSLAKSSNKATGKLFLNSNKQATQTDKPKSDTSFAFKSPKGAFSRTTDRPSSSNVTGSKSQSLVKLQDLINSDFPYFQTSLRNRHVLLEKDGNALAMLTIDHNRDLGRRRLCKVEVINFNAVPSVNELKIEFMGL